MNSMRLHASTIEFVQVPPCREIAETVENVTKLLLSQHTDQTIAQNTKHLATFGEGIQEQLGQFNCRVENVEHDTSELKTDVEQMQALLAEVQDDQKRQAEVLLLANCQGVQAP